MCSAPGCPDFANGHGHAHPQKCFRHTCQRTECSEIVQDNNPNSHFCLTHACADPVCTNESTIPGGYCYTHACTIAGCRAPRERGSPFFPTLCTLHGDERAEQQERYYHYTTSPSRATSRSSSRTSSHDSRRRPRSFRPQQYHYPTYQDPFQASEAGRRYAYHNIDDHYIPRWRHYDWSI